MFLLFVRILKTQIFSLLLSSVLLLLPDQPLLFKGGRRQKGKYFPSFHPSHVLDSRTRLVSSGYGKAYNLQLEIWSSDFCATIGMNITLTSPAVSGSSYTRNY